MNTAAQDHYTSIGMQPIEVMKANMTQQEFKGFLKGNIEKYLWRRKGQDLLDYKKIVVYAQWLVEWEEQNDN